MGLKFRDATRRDMTTAPVPVPVVLKYADEGLYTSIYITNLSMSYANFTF